MDRYEVMAGKMTPLTDGAHRKWGFAGKVETRSYERLVDALIDFVETGDGLKARFLTGFAACLAADRNPREDARITDTMKEFTWFMGRRYKLVDAADHIGYEWTGRAHGSLADALATLAVQRWLEQWLVAE